VNPQRSKWEQRAALRAAQEVWSLGFVLKAYQELEEKNELQVATDLGCTTDMYHLLSLCRRPRPGRFAEDVDRISQRFGIDRNRLAAVIRRAEVLGNISRSQADGQADALLAARDRADPGDDDKS
jgi:hypothetical protein